MRATRFPEANKILTAPPGQKAEVYDLPVWSDGSRCISCWQPTEEERAAIARGAPVWLWVRGATHPPVAVEVLSPFVASFDPMEGARERDEIDTRTHSLCSPSQAQIDDVVRRMVGVSGGDGMPRFRAVAQPANKGYVVVERVGLRDIPRGWTYETEIEARAAVSYVEQGIQWPEAEDIKAAVKKLEAAT